MKKKIIFSLILLIGLLPLAVSAISPGKRAVKLEKFQEQINGITRHISSQQSKFCDPEFLSEWEELDPVWFCGIDLPEAGPVPETGLVISEVYFNVAAERGSDPENEWIEIYNGANDDLDISGYTIADSQNFDTLPIGSIVPGRGRLLIVANSDTATFWTIPASANVVNLNSSLGSNGLGNEGDALFLKNGSDVIDAVNWGTNTNVFSPSAIPAPKGYSLSRKNLKNDTNKYKDWIVRATPTPGK